MDNPATLDRTHEAPDHVAVIQGALPPWMSPDWPACSPSWGWPWTWTT